MTPDKRVNEALETVLRASWLGLENHVSCSALARMREAMRKILVDEYTAGSNHCHLAIKSSGRIK